jgi:hypothetical protein
MEELVEAMEVSLLGPGRHHARRLQGGSNTRVRWCESVRSPTRASEASP